MSDPGRLGLPEALERAASALREHARAIRPANGDPARLLEALGPEAGARVLAWLLANEPADGEELAAAWSEDEETGVAALRRLEAEALPKPARKALRRILHRLRSRGLELSREEPAPVVAKLPVLEDTLSASFVSPIDPRGTRAAYLVDPHPAGGARLFEVLIDAERGVIGFELFQATRSQARRFLREIASSARLPAVAVPRDALRALVERAAAAQPPDRPLPRGFAEWRGRIAAPPEGAQTPGELAAAALGAEAAPERLPRAIELLRAGEIGPWPPPPEELQALAERLLESAKGQILVAASARREQVARALDEAAISLGVGPRAARCAASFRETAYLLWRGGREEDARAALAAAAAFEAGSERSAGVTRAMLEVSLAPVLEQVEREIAGEEDRTRQVRL